MPDVTWKWKLSYDLCNQQTITYVSGSNDNAYCSCEFPEAETFFESLPSNYPLQALTTQMLHLLSCCSSVFFIDKATTQLGKTFTLFHISSHSTKDKIHQLWVNTVIAVTKRLGYHYGGQAQIIIYIPQSSLKNEYL